MRKSVQKALANKRPQKQFQASGEVTNYEGAQQRIRSMPKSGRKGQPKVIEESFGHLPIR